MLVYQNVSLGAVVNGAPILINVSPAIAVGQINPQPITSLGLLCKVSAGASLTYSAQISCDNPNSAIVNWVDHDVLSGLTASQFASIIYPVSAVRLIVSVWASGTVNLGIVQWP